MMRRCGVAVVLSILFLSIPALPQSADPMAIAGQIESALGAKRIDQAYVLWEQYEEDVLGNVGACLKAGRAWADFAGLKEVLRYQDIPADCLDRALACFDSVDKKLMEEDHENRILVARGLMKVGDVYIEIGTGDKAAAAQDRALAMLEALAALESHPAGVHADLGAAYSRLAKREPPKAEEHTAKAAAQYDLERKESGDSSHLCRCIGETRQLLAETREELLARTPKDKALAKGVVEAWGQALVSYEQALKGDAKNQELKTLYNECLWEAMRVTEGKAKQKPLMKECKARYATVKLKLPDSEWWKVTEEDKFKRDDDLFEALKYDRKSKQGLFFSIDRYEWRSNYVNEETGEAVGGDNIGGLARRSEKSARSYFKNVKDMEKLHPLQLNKRITKAETFSVKGMTEDNYTAEYRCIFFKESSRQATFKITVIADLGMLDRCPYEMDAILDTIEVIPRK
ncbi:MAG: hypothetical protein MUE73_04330 [Planctomycetes bacterium]|nr:hypothetical protein [Planctomycetota bacterium]